MILPPCAPEVLDGRCLIREVRPYRTSRLQSWSGLKVNIGEQREFSPDGSLMCSIGNLEMFYPMNFFGDLYSHDVVEQIQRCCPSGNLGHFFICINAK